MKLWYVMPYISQLKVCFSCQESPLYLQAFYLVAYTFQVKALCFLVFFKIQIVWHRMCLTQVLNANWVAL